MKSLVKPRAWLTAMVVAVLSVTACGGGSSNNNGSSSTSTRPSTTVKIGCNREISEAFLWNIGEFASKYNIVPQCVEMESYVASLQAVEKGDVDIGILGYPQIATLADAAASGVKVVVGYGLAGQNIVERKGLNLTSWSGIQGKTVCGPLPTGAGQMLQIAMIENNVDFTKVKLVQTGFTGTAELQQLQSGQCDVLDFWSPVVDTAVVDGYGQYMPNLDINKTTIGPGNGVMLAGAHMLGDKALLVDFLKAFTASLEDMKAHPDKWASVATQLTGSRADVVKEALKHQGLDYGVDVAAAKGVAKYGPKFGFAKSDQTNSVASFIDVSYLAAATGKSESDLTKPLKFQ